MKIVQDLIVFDLEATSSENPKGYQENKNIIQIGATYLKRIDNERYEMSDSFHQLVQPTNAIISPFIEELTGVTNEKVKDAPLFTEASEMFVNWARGLGNIKNVRLCAWGTYFDMPLLRKHFNERSLKFPFSGTAYDAKTWACLWLMLSGRRTDKMSVEHLAKLMEIPQIGKYHDAEVDAIMTAKIVQRIMSDLDNGFFVDQAHKGKSLYLKISD